MQNAADQPDFSSPWHMSDVILVVEDQHLHAHRCILSMCSPVFEKMFNGEFKEKYATEIPLPDKKAEEVRELLLAIYPTAKPINEDSVHFLLSLAQDYQINLVTTRCEEYLLQRDKSDADAVKFLLVAQKFDLKDLYKQCVEMAMEIKLEKLRELEDYNSINCELGKEIAEGRVELLEEDMKTLKEASVSFLRKISTLNCADDSKITWEAASKKLRGVKGDQIVAIWVFTHIMETIDYILEKNWSPP